MRGRREGGTPLLLLPDCGQSGASWPEAFLGGLGDALPVLRPDWPEGALSDEGGCTTEGLAAGLWEKLQGWGVGRAHAGVGPSRPGSAGIAFTRRGGALGLTRPGAALGAQWAAAAAFEGYERLPRVGQPTLVVHGESDVVVLAENGRTLRDRIPGARFALLAGAGHLALHDAPAEGAALVREFLASPGEGAVGGGAGGGVAS